MNINNFEYEELPVSLYKNYGVHRLSEDGVKAYFGKHSYANRFLKNLSPERCDEYFDHNLSPIYNNKENKDSKFLGTSGNKEIKNLDCLSELDSNAKKEKDDEKIKIKNLKSPRILFHSASDFNIHAARTFYPSSNTNKNTQFKLFSPPRTTFSRNIKQQKDMKFETDYEWNLNTLKTSIKNSTSQNFFRIKDNLKLKGNIKSYQIPRLEQFNSLKVLKERYPKVKYFNKVMEKTIKTKKCEDENERLVEFISLLKKEEKLSQFPKISHLANQRKLRNASIHVVNNKSLGEKYNPQNFEIKSKNKTKRNEFGALFHK
jgi:hypothetical protein